MPVVMSTRCIVVVGAAPGKQGKREKKRSQAALPEGTLPGIAFPLRIKNVFIHIKLRGVIHENLRQLSSTG